MKWSGLRGSDPDGMIRTIMALVGTPQRPRVWTDPDSWIPDCLTGPNEELASRIWANSAGKVNPRYLRGPQAYIRRHALLAPDSREALRLTGVGARFMEREEATVRAVDTVEGLLDLLEVVARVGPDRAAVREAWDAICRGRSNLNSATGIQSALRARVKDLDARGLLRASRIELSLTAGGKTYLAG